MIYCNNCGERFDAELGVCPECGAQVPEGPVSPESSAKTADEVRAERVANLTAPIPDTTSDTSAKAPASEAGTAAAKTITPPDPPNSETPPTAHKNGTDSASHEEMMAMLHSMGKKIVLIRRSVNRHGKAVVGGLTAIFLVLLGIFGQELWQRWQHPQPDAIWIEVENNASQVLEGTPVKLTARTSPVENVPREFKWHPAEMIQGNGQQSVTLNTSTSHRHTESYTVTVGLTAVDQLGNNCVAVKGVTITIVPLHKWNNPPEWEETIHIEGSPEVTSGASVSLDALASDKDGDKLKYDWSVGSKLVQIDGDGDRRVILRLPRDFARRTSVLLTVKLSVSDGVKSILDDVTLTVTPAGRVRISRPKPKSVPPKPASSPTQPGSGAPPKVESTPSMAVPQSSPNVS
jgi:hypothetical protein